MSLSLTRIRKLSQSTPAGRRYLSEMRTGAMPAPITSKRRMLLALAPLGQITKWEEAMVRA